MIFRSDCVPRTDDDIDVMSLGVVAAAGAGGLPR
jgi:hypothetical protein